MNKVKAFKVSAVIFAVLTICGAIYVMSTGGKASPGFAVVPMCFSLTLFAMARKSKKKASPKTIVNYCMSQLFLGGKI